MQQWPGNRSDRGHEPHRGYGVPSPFIHVGVPPTSAAATTIPARRQHHVSQPRNYDANQPPPLTNDSRALDTDEQLARALSMEQHRPHAQQQHLHHNRHPQTGGERRYHHHPQQQQPHHHNPPRHDHPVGRGVDAQISSDEALARRLQAEENAHLAGGFGGGGRRRRQQHQHRHQQQDPLMEMFGGMMGGGGRRTDPFSQIIQAFTGMGMSPMDDEEPSSPIAQLLSGRGMFAMEPEMVVEQPRGRRNNSGGGVVHVITLGGGPNGLLSFGGGGSGLEAILHMLHEQYEPQVEGASQDVIDAASDAWKLKDMKQLNVDADTENTNCTVCLSDFELEETLRTLPCNHIFHRDCVDRWLKTNKSCPCCRQDIEEAKPQSPKTGAQQEPQRPRPEAIPHDPHQPVPPRNPHQRHRHSFEPEASSSDSDGNENDYDEPQALYVHTPAPRHGGARNPRHNQPEPRTPNYNYYNQQQQPQRYQERPRDTHNGHPGWGHSHGHPRTTTSYGGQPHQPNRIYTPQHPYNLQPQMHPHMQYHRSQQYPQYPRY
eukprot:TRINITY_DN20652_c0_g1_i1.p1 TRINITY_DN20652_c0_g1~~TRINITY_DN20652_c0_g1_i1.p1  ORF type:complete len:544 (-),score=52.48 TRINITY_DN20652_c0_g1_i1:1289-2920(-)